MGVKGRPILREGHSSYFIFFASHKFLGFAKMVDFLGLSRTIRSKMKSNTIVVKLWNGSKALQISRNGLDC